MNTQKLLKKIINLIDNKKKMPVHMWEIPFCSAVLQRVNSEWQNSQRNNVEKLDYKQILINNKQIKFNYKKILMNSKQHSFTQKECLL